MSKMESRTERAFVAVVLLLALAGCGRPSATTAKPIAAAKVEKQPQETEIARITLTPEAEQRLGITLGPVVQRPVGRRRTFGGEVIVPVGKAIVVSAPVAGLVTAPESGSIPQPGQRVAVGDAVLTLVPLLSPERDVPTPAERVLIANARATLLAAETVAKGDMQRGRAELDAAQIAFDRATKLLADKAGSAMAVDSAMAVRDVALASFNAAQERAQQLTKLVRDLDASGTTGEPTVLLLKSPQAGLLRDLAVSRGQTVTAGARLFEVVDLSSVWVRVPIYVDGLSSIQMAEPARITPLGNRGTSIAREARPVAAPPTADSLSTSLDLIYETDNRDGSLRPGQRVGVDVSLIGPETALTVPTKAVLYDVQGGSWVYVKVKAVEHAFERRRVSVRFTIMGTEELAVLETGPPAGTEVVLDGAAELFGTEFGTGK